MAKKGCVYWDKEKVMKELRKKAELSKGHPFYSDDLPHGAYTHVNEYFGTWEKALETVGVDWSLPKVRLRKSNGTKGGGPPQSLCWSCKRAYAIAGLGCEWFTDKRLPFGARFRKKPVLQGGRHASYWAVMVVECPKFIDDGKKVRGHLDDEGAERLIYEIVKDAAKDLRKGESSAKKFFESDWFEELTGMTVSKELMQSIANER